MPELLRTVGDVKDALTLAILQVTLGDRVALEKIRTLRDRRERCRSLPHIDPPLGRLLGAVDLWLVQIDQWRRTGVAKQRGGAVQPPSGDRDALSEALGVYCRELNPALDMPARRQADQEREEMAMEYFASKSPDG